MGNNIFIPKLGMGMREAKVLEWKAKEGDLVKEQQVILVIETDKVTSEIEAPASGFLHILAEPGSVLPVGDVAGILAVTEEELSKLQKEHPTALQLAELAEEEEEEMEVAVAAAVQAMPRARERVKISPVARKMAKEHGMDFTQLKGTGPEGRITKADIERALETKEAEVVPAAEAAPSVKVAPAMGVYDGKNVKATLQLTGMRQAIAEHMLRSLSVSAQLTTMAEVEMTEMIRRRDFYLERETAIGVRVSYTDLFVLVLAKALKDNSILNSSLIDNEIKIWDDINIGVAVSLDLGEYESGLIVPVVKHADKKSLLEINQIVRDLTERARSRKLVPDDVGGGTFTLSNVGGFGLGWALSTPIINQPQSAILQTGPIEEKPVVREGQVVIRPMMQICLTWDHRVMDGAPATKFLVGVKELMENPDLLLL